MKKVIFLLAPIVLCLSCQKVKVTSNYKQANQLIFTKTVKEKGNNKVGVIEFFKVFKNNYLEIDLNTHYTEDLQECYFMAEKKLEDFTSVQNGSNVIMYVVDEKGGQVKFKNNHEFLNYIKVRGYKVIKQSKLRGKIKYLFKRSV